MAYGTEQKCYTCCSVVVVSRCARALVIKVAIARVDEGCERKDSRVWACLKRWGNDSRMGVYAAHSMRVWYSDSRVDSPQAIQRRARGSLIPHRPVSQRRW